MEHTDFIMKGLPMLVFYHDYMCCVHKYLRKVVKKTGICRGVTVQSECTISCFVSVGFTLTPLNTL